MVALAVEAEAGEEATLTFETAGDGPRSTTGTPFDQEKGRLLHDGPEMVLVNQERSGDRTAGKKSAGLRGTTVTEKWTVSGEIKSKVVSSLVVLSKRHLGHLPHTSRLKCLTWHRMIECL